MNIRTDLALDITEKLNKNSKDYIIKEECEKDVSATLVEIKNNNGEKLIGKRIGKYITINIPSFSHKSELLDYRLLFIKKYITMLLPKNSKNFLVVGLGNENITPDALGPKTIKNIFATRHIENSQSDIMNLPKFNSVSAISTGVLAQTGIETMEYVKSLYESLKPDALIVIDAFATNSFMRLGTTIQISDTGISPGSGVHNKRKEISYNTMGVPVISIGIPTVIDYDFSNDTEAFNINNGNNNLIVTPKDIDLIIDRGSLLLGLGINCALNTQVNPELFLSLM